MKQMPQADAVASRRRLLALAALVVVIMLWSGNMIVGRAIRNDIPPFLLALIRWVGALLVVLPFAARHLVRDRETLLAGWRAVLMLGLTGVASFNAFIYSGLHHTTATNASLLQAAVPPLVLVADRVIFGVRSRSMQVAGILIATVGVVMIVCQGSFRILLGLHFGIGDILVLCGVVVWALYTSLLRLRPACHPLSLLAVTFAIGVVAMLPLAASEHAQIAIMHWTPTVIAGCLYVAVLPSVVAYALYNAAVAEVGAGVAGQAISLMPPFGAILATFLLNEPLHGYHAIGMTFITLGIAVGWLAQRRLIESRP